MILYGVGVYGSLHPCRFARHELSFEILSLTVLGVAGAFWSFRKRSASEERNPPLHEGPTAVGSKPLSGFAIAQILHFVSLYPHPREDLESRSPSLGPYATTGTL